MPDVSPRVLYVGVEGSSCENLLGLAVCELSVGDWGDWGDS